MDNISNRVRIMIAEKLPSKVNRQEIKNTTSLFDLGLDSIRLLELIVEIEEEFNIIFKDDDLVMENLQTLSNLVSYIKGKKKDCDKT